VDVAYGGLIGASVVPDVHELDTVRLSEIQREKLLIENEMLRRDRASLAADNKKLVKDNVVLQRTKV
jgi:hypothetical protein